MDFKNITVGEITVLLGIIAAVYAFYKMIKDVRKPREERDKKIDADLKEHKGILDKHESILNVHTKKFEKINSVLDEISEEVKESSETTRESDELIKSALCAIQRQSILNMCEACLRVGFATLEQKETISIQYKSYNNLGGNGFVTDIYKHVMDLPISIEEEI